MGIKSILQEAQLPQRNSVSAAHVYLGWLTDHAMHRTLHNQCQRVTDRRTDGRIYYS